MQVCTLLQTDNHTSTHTVFYRLDALLAAQPTASLKALIYSYCYAEVNNVKLHEKYYATKNE